MEDSEKVADYFNRLQLLVNQIKSCGEAFTDISVVEKVLRTLSDKFDNVVTTIEECGRDMKTLSIKELQATLEAHEMKHSVRSSEKKGEEQALKDQISKNRGSGRGKWKSNRGGGRFGRGAHSSVQELGSSEQSEQKVQDGRGSWNNRGRGGRKNVDMKKIQCYNCEKWGHYAADCWRGKEKQKRSQMMLKRMWLKMIQKRNLWC